MFWIYAAIVVVLLVALAWFVSGRQKTRVSNPHAHGTHSGAMKGSTAMKDIGRNTSGGNGPAKV